MITHQHCPRCGTACEADPAKSRLVTDADIEIFGVLARQDLAKGTYVVHVVCEGCGLQALAPNHDYVPPADDDGELPGLGR